MATVDAVITALQGLDPVLQVGALRVERHGEVTAFDVGDVVEIHVEHDSVSGRPRAAWVVVGLLTAATPEELYGALPVTWTVSRDGCGCLMPVPVRPGRRVATLAVPCEHYEPSRVAVAWAALEVAGDHGGA